MRINWSKREMIMKVVYFGPSQGGKTTNLQSIYSKLNPQMKGQFMSINTQEDRTLFFDFFDMTTTTRFKGGSIKVRFELYTVPGQVKYEETRRLVMRGADGVVFVADSQTSKLTENLYSRADLDEILQHYGQDPETFPTVIQYNKRDLKDISSVDELSKALNPRFNLEFQSVAITGENVMETLRGITQSVIKAGRKKHMQ